MASISPSTRAQNISAATPICCSASCRRTSEPGRNCTRPSRRSPCARDRRTCSWHCAACGRWSCGCARRSGRRSPGALARGRPEVLRVLYPALESDPGHAIWKRDFTGASGLFSVVLRPVRQRAVAAMIDGLALFGIGSSWGGYRKPDRSRSLCGTHGDQMGARRPDASGSGRPRGHRGPQGGPRCRLRHGYGRRRRRASGLAPWSASRGR